MRNLRNAHKIKVRSTQENKKKVGAQLDSEFKANMQTQLSSFQEGLEKFLLKHRVEINKDAALRHQFYSLCRELGVDPLICKH